MNEVIESATAETTEEDFFWYELPRGLGTITLPEIKLGSRNNVLKPTFLKRVNDKYPNNFEYQLIEIITTFLSKADSALLDNLDADEIADVFFAWNGTTSEEANKVVEAILAAGE